MRWLLAVCLAFVGMAFAVPANDVPVNQMAVVDLANVLSATERETLESQLRQMAKAGYMQAAVVIVPSTDGAGMFDYGLSIAERWRLGEAKKDNGLLLLIAIKDRKLRFFQGYGLEGDLPDLALDNVIRKQITPYFKQGEYAKGISAGFERIAQALSGEGLPLPKGPDGGADGEAFDFGILPFLLIFSFGWARALVRHFGVLVTWLLATGVGSGIMLAIFGLSWMALFATFALSVVALVVALMPAPPPGRRSGGPVIIPGSGGRSSSGFPSGGGGWSSYGGGGGGFGGGGAGGSW